MELLLVTRAIYPLHGYGGLERHCYDWVNELSRLGCRIHVVTQPPGEKTVLSVFPEQTSFYFIPGNNARTVLQRITTYPLWVERVRNLLARLTRQTAFQAIYAQGLAAAGCTELGIPLYYNPHGMEEFKCTGLKHLAYTPFRSLSRTAASYANKIIATDQSLITDIGHFFSVSDNKIALIPNAVPLNKPEVKPQNTNPVFLSIGRLEKNKGFDILLQAFSMGRNLSPGWRATLVGSGSEFSNLRRLAKRLGLEEKVTFTGAVPDKQLEDLYAAAGLFIHPALYEGSSIVTLEAMKHALPILGTNIGGLPDKVIPGKNGWLVPPNDPQALSAALETACSQRDIWPELGLFSLQIVRDRYSWEQVAKIFLELFQTSKLS
jgi:glycogen(starch) synthase